MTIEPGVATIAWDPGEIRIRVESAGHVDDVERTRITLGDGNLTIAMTLDTEDAQRLSAEIAMVSSH